MEDQGAVKRKTQKRAKHRQRRPNPRSALKGKSRQKKGLGTEIAELFREVGLKPGEEIPELRGFTIEPPDFGE